jgi:hypothetical protein
MTLYYYMYRSWQDCCRRGENRSWSSVSVESVDIEYWSLNNAIVYAFIMRLTVEERVLRSTFKLNTLYKVHIVHEKLHRVPDIDVSLVTTHVKENGHEICNLICHLCLQVGLC